MSYRFANLSSLYPEFLRDFYGRNPGLETLPYSEHLARLRAASSGWSVSMCEQLRKNGAETCEIYSNAEPLQKAWARENGMENADPLAVIQKQLHSFRPDVLSVEDLPRFHGTTLESIRSSLPGLRRVVGIHCAPYSPAFLAGLKPVHALVTCSPGMKTDFERNGLPTLLLYHAFDPKLLTRVSLAKEKRYDLLFAGSVHSGPGMHNQRRVLLERLVREGVNLSLFGTSAGPQPLKDSAKWLLSLGNELLARTPLERVSPRSPLLKKLRAVRGFGAPRLRDPLAARLQPPLWGARMLEAISAARVTLNNHIDASGDFAANMRLFETTGIGSCLLTDRKRNLNEIFAVDSEVVDYGSPEECAEKARWLIGNPAKAAAIAEAGHRRCLRDHTYEIRGKMLHEWILASLR